MNVTMSELSQIVKDLPKGKSSGRDSLNGDNDNDNDNEIILLT